VLRQEATKTVTKVTSSASRCNGNKSTAHLSWHAVGEFKYHILPGERKAQDEPRLRFLDCDFVEEHAVPLATIPSASGDQAPVTLPVPRSDPLRKESNDSFLSRKGFSARTLALPQPLEHYRPTVTSKVEGLSRAAESLP
jgi:hypothetical protein